MIHITIFRINTVFLIDQMLNHGRLYSTCYIESDILYDLIISNEMSILDLQVMRMMHKHSFAPNVLLFIRVPTESDLHRAINQIICLDSNPLIYLPLIQLPFVAAQHELCDEPFFIFDPLKPFELYSMRESDAIICLQSLFFGRKPRWKLSQVHKFFFTVLKVFAYFSMFSKATMHNCQLRRAILAMIIIVLIIISVESIYISSVIKVIVLRPEKTDQVIPVHFFLTRSDLRLD